MGSLGIDQPVTIAIIGAGTIGVKHASIAAELPNASLACIVDPSPSGQSLATLYQVPYYTDVQQMLREEVLPEIAIICTPNKTHVPIGRQLIGYGIHLLMEKPFSSSVSEGQAFLTDCQKQGVHIAVGHHRRHNPFIRAAHKALQSGSIGKPVGVSGIWAALKPKEYFEGSGTWHTGAEAGVVMTNLIHEMDLLQMLLGPIVRVFAEQAPSLRGYQAEEGVAVTLRFKNGLIGSFIALDNAPSPYNIEAGTGENPAFPCSGQDCYWIFGDQGSLSVPDMTLWKPHSLAKGRKSTLERTQLQPDVTDDAYERQLSNFVAVLRGQEVVMCSGEDGLRAVAVCDAIKKSIRCTLPVDVELV